MARSLEEHTEFCSLRLAGSVATVEWIEFIEFFEGIVTFSPDDATFGHREFDRTEA